MKTILLLIFIITTIGGCAGSPQQMVWEANDNRKAMTGLNIGMSKQQVLKVMGEPRKTEAYIIEGRNVMFWLYLTESPGRNIDDSDYTPLAFENETLTGWGRNFYDKSLKYEHEINIK